MNDVPGKLELEKLGPYDSDNTVADKKRFTETEARWKKCVPAYTKIFQDNFSEQEKIEELRQELDSLSSLQLFEKIFSNEILSNIKNETQKYASRVKNEHEFKIETDELKTFISIVLFSGYHKLPSERMYWSTKEDLGVEIVKNSMYRNRYLKVKQMLHSLYILSFAINS